MRKLAFSSLLALTVITTGCGSSSLESVSSNQATPSNNSEEVNLITLTPEYPQINSDDEMKEKADLIIKGTIKETEERMIDIAAESQNELEDTGGSAGNTIFPYQVSEVDIKEIYKGEEQLKSKDSIELKQLGGHMDGETVGSEEDVEIVEDGAVQIEEGKEYILFLQTFEDAPASLINANESTFVEKDGKAINEKSETKVKEIPVKELEVIE